jgi:hypothetical protein
MLREPYTGVVTVSQYGIEAFTTHAMLVIWGQFAQCLGLVQRLEAVPLHQKTVTHRPQTKVLEFLVAILGGFQHLQDISRSAHPLDQDQAVARAWGQPGWADYSGVSRSLAELTAEEAVQITQVLEEITQPAINQEVYLAAHAPDGIVYDGDLTGRPVSNTSTSYPGAAYGHMDNDIRLGYQAALVSMSSPNYGRLWLSVTPHPGDTVACSQAQAMVLAAERRTGVRPLRRTQLLQDRLGAVGRQRDQLAQQVARAQQALARAEVQLTTTQQQVQYWQQAVANYELAYQQRVERPHSRLAQARRKLATYTHRCTRRERAVKQAQSYLHRRQAHLDDCQVEMAELQTRLEQFERDNATNALPVQATFRLDAGFGTRDNLALLIEMGYQVYSKPHGTWLLNRLKGWVDNCTPWVVVGSNAEMTAWDQVQLQDFPYPLDLALERFYTGPTQRHSVLLHYGDAPVTTALPAWFERYNARQTIEAGIKEGKQVFTMHHLKVRTPVALYLQEHFAVFAANFVRLAATWLADQHLDLPDGWGETTHLPVKQQVLVAAHTSAWVTWYEQYGCLLRFTDHSVFARRSLQVNQTWAYQLVLPFAKSCCFVPI